MMSVDESKKNEEEKERKDEERKDGEEEKEREEGEEEVVIEKDEKCGKCHRLCKDGHLAINCDGCKQWMHLHCSQIPLQVFNFYHENELSKSGFYWICISCRTKSDGVVKVGDASGDHHSPKSTANAAASNPLNTGVTSPTSPDAVISGLAKSLPGISPGVSNFKDASQMPSERLSAATKIPPLCSHYKRGRCRHGISGKKLVYGKECSFLHPRKCIKYCRYGNDKHKGCRGGCNFFHPILCRNSVWHKKCYEENCTFQHLSGTDHGRGSSFPQFSRSPDPKSVWSRQQPENMRRLQRQPNRPHMYAQPGQVHGWNEQGDNAPVSVNYESSPPIQKYSQDTKIEENSSY